MIYFKLSIPAGSGLACFALARTVGLKDGTHTDQENPSPDYLWSEHEQGVRRSRSKYLLLLPWLQLLHMYSRLGIAENNIP